MYSEGIGIYDSDGIGIRDSGGIGICDSDGIGICDSNGIGIRDSIPGLVWLPDRRNGIQFLQIPFFMDFTFLRRRRVEGIQFHFLPTKHVTDSNSFKFQFLR